MIIIPFNQIGFGVTVFAKGAKRRIRRSERGKEARDREDPWDVPASWSIPVVNPLRGIGRNDPCPCGSGKKFKKCCLNRQGEASRPSVLEHVDGEPEGWLSDDGPDIIEMEEGLREYDPLIEPDPRQWLIMAEQQRLDLVVAYHRRALLDEPRQEVHATIHVIVENQIADDTLPVRQIAERLMSEGLDRHEAVHAIGSVLAGHLNDMIRKARSESEPSETSSDLDQHEAYFAELESLTAEEWLRSG